MRALLRERSRDRHVATEAAFESYDLNEEMGLTGALRAHALALSQLLPALDDAPEYRVEVQRLLDLTISGLAALEAPRPSSQSAEEWSGPPVMNPLGVAYVVLGSRLGARVIARGLHPTTSDRMKRARAYFVDEASAPAWRHLQAELSTQRSAIDQDDIVGAALAAFRIFESAALSCQADQEALHV